MNCEEFRRKLLEDPSRREPDFLGHRAGCEDCDREAREVERMEAGLRRLLQAPPPPELKQNLYRAPRRRGWLPVALAATLAGLTALGAWWWEGSGAGGGAAIVAEALYHIEHEPEAFAAGPAMPVADWKALSPRIEVDTRYWRHAVTFAAPCEMMQKPGLHLVVAGEAGPVTVLVIVDSRVDEPRLFREDRMRGVVRPLVNGTLAVVSDGSPVDDLAAQLAPRITIRI